MSQNARRGSGLSAYALLARMPSTPSPRRRSRDYDGSSRGKWRTFADQVVKAFDAEDTLRSGSVSSIAELGRGPTVIGSDARGACSSRHAEVQPRGTAGVERLDRYNYSFLTDSSFDGRTSRAGRRAPSQSSAAATGRRRALRRRNTRPCRACWCSPLRGKKRSAAPGDDWGSRCSGRPGPTRAVAPGRRRGPKCSLSTSKSMKRFMGWSPA